MIQPVGEGLAFIISLPLVLTDPPKLKGEYGRRPLPPNFFEY